MRRASEMWSASSSSVLHSRSSPSSGWSLSSVVLVAIITCHLTTVTDSIRENFCLQPDVPVLESVQCNNNYQIQIHTAYSGVQVNLNCENRTAAAEGCTHSHSDRTEEFRSICNAQANRCYLNVTYTEPSRYCLDLLPTGQPYINIQYQCRPVLDPFGQPPVIIDPMQAGRVAYNHTPKVTLQTNNYPGMSSTFNNGTCRFVLSPNEILRIDAYEMTYSGEYSELPFCIRFGSAEQCASVAGIYDVIEVTGITEVSIDIRETSTISGRFWVDLVAMFSGNRSYSYMDVTCEGGSLVLSTVTAGSSTSPTTTAATTTTTATTTNTSAATTTTATTTNTSTTPAMTTSSFPSSSTTPSPPPTSTTSTSSTRTPPTTTHYTTTSPPPPPPRSSPTTSSTTTPSLSTQTQVLPLTTPTTTSAASSTPPAKTTTITQRITSPPRTTTITQKMTTQTTTPNTKPASTHLVNTTPTTTSSTATSSARTSGTTKTTQTTTVSPKSTIVTTPTSTAPPPTSKPSSSVSPPSSATTSSSSSTSSSAAPSSTTSRTAQSTTTLPAPTKPAVVSTKPAVVSSSTLLPPTSSGDINHGNGVNALPSTQKYTVSKGLIIGLVVTIIAIIAITAILVKVALKTRHKEDDMKVLVENDENGSIPNGAPHQHWEGWIDSPGTDSDSPGTDSVSTTVC